MDAFVASLAGRLDPEPLLAGLQDRWSDLLAPLRERGPSVAESLLAGLLGPGAGLAGTGGFLEVLAWIRGVRSGTEVVHGRLGRAAARAVGDEGRARRARPDRGRAASCAPPTTR